MKRIEFEILKWKDPESRIGQRSRLEQKTRDRLAKAIIEGDEEKEKKFRIKYISQKIEGKAKTPLKQYDLQFILSLPEDDLKLLPQQPKGDRKHMYCSKLFGNIKLDGEVRKELKEKAAKEVYLLIKKGIDDDNVFKYIYIDYALEYLSQHELADILIYNSNSGTRPYGQLDILARRFDCFPKLDPLEIAKKFEAQVGIRGKVYQYGSDPIEMLIYNCDHLTPEFEEYLIEKGYERELKKRKERDSDESKTKSKEDNSLNTEKEENYESGINKEIDKDKSDLLYGVNERNNMISMFRKLANKTYDALK